MNAEPVTYFDIFGVDDIPKKIRKFIRNKNIMTSIYRIQAYDSIMCGCFYIGFIDSMLKDQSLLAYTYLFFPKKSKKNEKMVLTRIWVGFLDVYFVVEVGVGGGINLNQIPKTRDNYVYS